MKEISGKTTEEIKDQAITVGGKKLTSKEIASRISKMKKSSLSGWDKIFKKFNPKELHTQKDLEGMLPKSISANDIQALFAEDIDESETVAGDIASAPKPIFKKKKDEDETDLIRRNNPSI